MTCGCSTEAQLFGLGFMALTKEIKKVNQKNKKIDLFFCNIFFFFLFTGLYGTIGLGTTNTTPGARDSSVSWVDVDGYLWLFGGDGYGSTDFGEFIVFLMKRTEK